MYPLFFLGLTAFLICIVITPLCRRLFVRFKLVDHPDSDRKFHLRAVPRMGGIPIFLSYALALGIFLLWNPGGGKLHIQHEVLLRAMLPAAAIIFLTGLIDDLFTLRAWQKLGGQVVGSVLAVTLGARLVLVHQPTWFSVVLSVVWLVGCTNAVNLIDGMDGLATGVGLLASVTALFVAVLTGNTGLALATLPLVGALLAFLRYNFSPASIFLGDCGSLTIGFVLGCFGLIWSQRTGTMLGMVAPLMALAVPLLDVGLAIGRRFLRAVPIFKADRGHIHHMVLRQGFSTRGAALLLYGVCGLCASLAVIESFSSRRFGWMVLLFFCGLVLFGIKRLGYVEFAAVRKTISHKVMLRAVQDEIYLQELDTTLEEVQDLDGWWDVVRDVCGDLQFSSAEAEFDRVYYSEEFENVQQHAPLNIQVRLGDRGSLHLRRSADEPAPAVTMQVVVRLQTAVMQYAKTVPVSQEERLKITAA